MSEVECKLRVTCGSGASTGGKTGRATDRVVEYQRQCCQCACCGVSVVPPAADMVPGQDPSIGLQVLVWLNPDICPIELQQELIWEPGQLDIGVVRFKPPAGWQRGGNPVESLGGHNSGSMCMWMRPLASDGHQGAVGGGKDFACFMLGYRARSELETMLGTEFDGAQFR